MYGDYTNAMQMNGGNPILGRAARALFTVDMNAPSPVSPIYPMRFLYGSQVWTTQLPNDGMPVVLDEENQFSFQTPAGDAAKLLLLCQKYAQVFKNIKTLAPDSPMSVYGFLPDDPWALATYPNLREARRLVTDLMDFTFFDTGQNQAPAAFDALLADGAAAIYSEYPMLPMVVKVEPTGLTDDEFARRLIAAATHPRIDQVCVWMSGDADWPQVAPTFGRISRDLAAKYPSKRALQARGLDRIVKYVVDQARRSR